MKLTVLGSGCPSVSINRYGPSALFDAGPGSRILVDCGSGVTQRLLEHGIPGKDIDVLLLTHLHSDHVIDLFQLILSSWHQGRERAQKVYGPPGTRRHVEELIKFWQPEIEQRVLHEKRSSKSALDVEVKEIASGSMMCFGEIAVEAVSVRHQPVKEALGFVFHCGSQSATVSGDTRYCPELIQASRGVDVLLHEVFIHGVMKPGGIRTQETIRNVESYHTLDSEVGRVASEAGVKCLMLTHFAPPDFDSSALLETVGKDFSGPAVISEDLMTLDLDSWTLSWRGMTVSPGAMPDLGSSA